MNNELSLISSWSTSFTIPTSKLCVGVDQTTDDQLAPWSCIIFMLTMYGHEILHHPGYVGSQDAAPPLLCRVMCYICEKIIIFDFNHDVIHLFG